MIDETRVYRHWPTLILAGVLPALLTGGIWAMWLVYNDGSAGSLVCPVATTAVLLPAAGYALRQRVSRDASGIRVRRTFRTVHVPWTDLRRIDVDTHLHLHLRDGRIVSTGAVGTAPVKLATRREGFGERVARELNAELGRRRGIAAPKIDADRTPAGKREKSVHLLFLWAGIP
ncbi:PH domain-containing protein [Catellatospora coxensis]